MEELNPYHAPQPLDISNLQSARGPTMSVGWFCAAFYGIALLAGARGAIATEKSAGGLVFQLAMAVCLGTWAIVDARQRQRPIPRSQRFWFFALASLVVPGYVIVTRGWRGLGWVVLHAVLWLVLYAAAMIFTYAILFGTGVRQTTGG